MSDNDEASTTIEAAKPPTNSCIFIADLQHRSKPMFSLGYHVRAETPSLVLYQGDNDKPTITLTSYIDDLPTRPFKLRFMEPTKPDDYNPINPASLDETFAGAPVLVDQVNKDLMHELEHYFEQLKSEFEQKIGKIWTPLRAWTKEE
jgi:hypothetical protein